MKMDGFSCRVGCTMWFIVLGCLGQCSILDFNSFGPPRVRSSPFGLVSQSSRLLCYHRHCNTSIGPSPAHHHNAFITDAKLLTELEDMLNFSAMHEPPTLELLDSTLRRFLALCAVYHGMCFCLAFLRLVLHFRGFGMGPCKCRYGCIRHPSVRHPFNSFIYLL